MENKRKQYNHLLCALKELLVDEMKFWTIVGSAHEQSNGDMDEKCELIRTALSKLPKDDARAFSAFFRAMMDRAY